MLAGPPVEVQVRVLDWSSKVKLVTQGEPTWIELLIVEIAIKKCNWNMRNMVGAEPK